MAANECGCPCRCQSARPRGWAFCAVCRRPLHRAAMAWAVPLARACGYVGPITDASAPDGVATSAQIRRRKRINPRGDGLCPDCPTDLDFTADGKHVMPADATDSYCFECGWTSENGSYRGDNE